MDGTPFGRYRLIELLGRGGMGEVWRAFDTETDRIVALKVLPAHSADDETFQTRFRREARAAAGLSEPHVVPIHGYGEIDGRLYVDMRLIVGRDLETVLREGPLDPARAVMIVEQVASALDAAHQIGLVHRDVKPSNILLTDADFAYLIDFGIAKAVGETGLTNTGATIGTWAYMAPERFTTTAEANSSSDVYALACVLYHCLTGQMPYPGTGIEHFYHGHVYGEIPLATVKNAGIPAALDGVIATGMAKNPDQRYPTTKDLAQAARAALVGTAEPIARPTPVPAAAPQTPPAQPPLQGAIVGSSSSENPDTGAEVFPSHHAPEFAIDPAIDTRTQAGPTVSAAYAPTQHAPLAALDGRHQAGSKPRPWWRRRKPAIITAVLAIVTIAVITIATLGLTNHDTTPPGQTTLPFTGLNQPDGVAVGADDTVYVTDENNSRVLKLPTGATTQIELPFTGLNEPYGVAVGADNTVYVTDRGNNRVLKLPTGATTQIELPFTVNSPTSVAVGADNTIYVTDTNNSRVLKLAAGATAPVELPFTGLNEPYGVAVGADNTVYVADTNNSRLLKLAAGATAPVELPFTGLKYPHGVAVGADNTVYVARNNRVLKLAAGATAPVELPFTGLDGALSVAVGTDNTVYITDGYGNHRVLKLAAGSAP